MRTKQKENSESLSIKVKENLSFSKMKKHKIEDILEETAFLKYLKVKKVFLQKYMNHRAWDKRNHKQLIVSFNHLLSYIKETRELANRFPEIDNDVTSDTWKLVLGTLPLAEEMRETLHQNYITNDQPKTIQNIKNSLDQFRNFSIMMYEREVMDDVNNHDSYAFDNKTFSPEQEDCKKRRSK